MEKALTKVASLKIGLGDSWITKKAKEEFTNISQDINVSSTNYLCFMLCLCLHCIAFCSFFPLMWLFWVVSLTLFMGSFHLGFERSKGGFFFFFCLFETTTLDLGWYLVACYI